MTKQRILDDFHYLAEFLEEMEWETAIVGEETEFPSLAASFYMDEDYAETAVCTYLQLPEEEVEFSKLMQVYIRIPVDLSMIHSGELMVLANQLNQLTAIGHFTARAAGESGGGYFAMRHVIPFPIDEVPDEGMFAESLLLMLHYCQMAEEFLLERLEGTPIETIIAKIPAGHDLRES